MEKEILKSTIKDIADEAGVSICTVSRALNNKNYIADETKKKVYAAVEKLNYRPNIIARSLRTNKTKTIGVIIPDISVPYFSNIVKIIEQCARKRGYTLLLGCSFYNLREEECQVEVLIDQVIDGLILFGGFDNYEHIKKIKEKKIPLVLLDRMINDDEVASVQINNIQTTKLAVDYLCGLGHRQICYIGITMKNSTVLINRLKGYKESLKRNKLIFNKDFVLLDDSILLMKEDGIYNLVYKFFKEKKSLTALIGPGDIYGPALIKAIKDLNLKIPDDVSIVAIGDNNINNYLDPPLTSIGVKSELMGSNAIDLLINLIEKKRIKKNKIVFDSELIIRSSVAKPRN